MTKKLTTSEAIFANKTSRVRPVDGKKDWIDVGVLVDDIDQGAKIPKSSKWEAEDPLVQQFVVVDKEGTVISCWDTEIEAIEAMREYPSKGHRIAHLREVRK